MFETETVGANVEIDRLALLGVTIVPRITLGAKDEMVNDAVAGVTV